LCVHEIVRVNLKTILLLEKILNLFCILRKETNSLNDREAKAQLIILIKYVTEIVKSCAAIEEKTNIIKKKSILELTLENLI
jgi:hypothetical protein